MESFRKDDIVVCILNNNASLTIGKQYRILITIPVSTTSGNKSTIVGGGYFEAKTSSCIKLFHESYITIENDIGEKTSYSDLRFISKSSFRNIKLNQILDEK